MLFPLLPCLNQELHFPLNCAFKPFDLYTLNLTSSENVKIIMKVVLRSYNSNHTITVECILLCSY